jgi:hypothetical protein
MTYLCRHRGEAEEHFQPTHNLGARRGSVVSITSRPFDPIPTGIGAILDGHGKCRPSRDSIPGLSSPSRIAISTTLFSMKVPKEINLILYNMRFSKTWRVRFLSYDAVYSRRLERRFWRNILLPSSKQKRLGEYKTNYHTIPRPNPEDKMWTTLTTMCTILIEFGIGVKQSNFPYTECNGIYRHVTSEVVSDEGQNTYECS